MTIRLRNKSPCRAIRRGNTPLLFMLCCFVMLFSSGVRAGKIGGGIGILTLGGYEDLLVFYTPDKSHWILGYRHNSGTERFDDPWSGEGITDTTETMKGPIVYYLFSNQKPHSLYVAAAYYDWTLTEESLWSASSDTDSAMELFLGFGYFGWINDHIFYNAGLLLSTGTELKAEEEMYGNSTEGDGFDLQLMMGIAF